MNGLYWEHRPPVVEPGWFPSYEVPEHVTFGDRHYVLFCTNSTAGPRFEPGAVSAHSGTYYVVADRIEGPYRPPQGDPLLLGNRDRERLFGTYVGRPLRVGSEVLFYHHWTARYPEAWYGPPKALVERASGRARTRLLAGLRGLEGRRAIRRRPPHIHAVVCGGRGARGRMARRAETRSRAVDRGGTHGVSLELREHRASAAPTDLADGRIVEVMMRLESGARPGHLVRRARGSPVDGRAAELRVTTRGVRTAHPRRQRGV